VNGSAASAPQRRAQPAAGPLAITLGDPAGIGPDIVLVAWRDRARLALPPFAVYGDPAVLASRAVDLGFRVAIAETTNARQACQLFTHALPVVPAPLPRPPLAGKPDPDNAPAVIAAIELATAAVVRSEALALVTGPIAKATLRAAGFVYPGHTEFLAALAERHAAGRKLQPVMMLVSEELRVVPVTVHIPLAAVPTALTPELLRSTIRIAACALERDFGISGPRLTVAGLNPHAGEEGSLGAEEKTVIIPVVEELRAGGLAVSGPHAADALFRAEARRSYDAAICMYHDQALIPLKTLAFDSGVNVTLGLPFVRTSPDHGTAFALAGSGKARAESFVAALRLAAEIATRRAVGTLPGA
jgi:4-hydroxythreonine-4-phosphate dehydrogenase